MKEDGEIEFKYTEKIYSDKVYIDTFDKDSSSPEVKHVQTNQKRLEISKEEFKEMFPLNRTTDKPKILVQWDDLCTYTGIGIVLYLKEKYNDTRPFSSDFYFDRKDEYVDCIDFAKAYFEDILSERTIIDEFENNYYDILKYSPISNTLISILKTSTYASHIVFYFKKDDKIISSILDGFEEYFIPRNKRKLCSISYVDGSEASFNEAIKKLRPNTVFCININDTLSYILENDELENIEIFGPDKHHCLPDEFIDYYFVKLEGLVLPKRCSVRLFSEVIHSVKEVRDEQLGRLGKEFT